MGEVSIIEPIEIFYHKKQIEALMKKAQPIVFHVPPPFPYQNSKIVPWKYIATVSVGGEEVQVPSAEIVNIYCSRGMTHNGHVSAPKYTPKVVPTPIIVPTYTL